MGGIGSFRTTMMQPLGGCSQWTRWAPLGLAGEDWEKESRAQKQLWSDAQKARSDGTSRSQARNVQEGSSNSRTESLVSSTQAEAHWASRAGGISDSSSPELDAYKSGLEVRVQLAAIGALIFTFFAWAVGVRGWTLVIPFLFAMFVLMIRPLIGWSILLILLLLTWANMKDNDAQQARMLDFSTRGYLLSCERLREIVEVHNGSDQVICKDMGDGDFAAAVLSGPSTSAQIPKWTDVFFDCNSACLIWAERGKETKYLDPLSLAPVEDASLCRISLKNS
ncbi:MAG TPA: hypothetical protein VMV42_00360, partial [archaeon]|nr:hypothetical protein [archaeon]